MVANGLSESIRAHMPAAFVSSAAISGRLRSWHAGCDDRDHERSTTLRHKETAMENKNEQLDDGVREELLTVEIPTEIQAGRLSATPPCEYAKALVAFEAVQVQAIG